MVVCVLPSFFHQCLPKEQHTIIFTLCPHPSNFKLFSPTSPNILHQPISSTMASHPETKIDCSKVYVKQSSFSNEQTGMFDGAFALVDIKEGELVEKGVMRRLPEGFDGNTCPYIFTWSTERPNKVNMI